MKTKQQTQKTTRKRIGDEPKDQTLKRAERDGVAMVAQRPRACTQSNLRMMGPPEAGAGHGDRGAETQRRRDRPA